MAKFNPPLLIVFEGIDGSGKTTVSKMLFDHMKSKNLPVIWLREPSDSKWGKKIRELSKIKTHIPLEEELNFFIEDRKHNVSRHIIPALNRNESVILDRYYYSTACYQGARGMDIAEIIQMNCKFAPEPDITFIIDVPVTTALDRIKKNRNSREKLFERKSFLEEVRRNYLSLSGDKIHVVDGDREIKSVFEQIILVLDL